MSQFKIYGILSLKSMWIGLGAVLSFTVFSCGEQAQKKPAGASAPKEECTDKNAKTSGTGTPAKTTKPTDTKVATKTVAAKLFLQGTGTATGTGTGTGTGTARKVTYNDNIRPLMQTNCGIGTCHAAAPRMLLGTYQVAKAGGAAILGRVSGMGGAIMPPTASTTLTLTVAQKALFTQWQTDGFLEVAPPPAPAPTPAPAPAPTPAPAPGNTSPSVPTNTSVLEGPQAPDEPQAKEGPVTKSKPATGTKTTKSSNSKAKGESSECQ